MGALENQVNQNTSSLQALIDESKNANELPELNIPIQDDDVFILRSNGITYHVKKSDLSDSVKSEATLLSFLENILSVGVDDQETPLSVDLSSLDQSEEIQQLFDDIAALDAAIILKGNWDASEGTFPGGGFAQSGYAYIVSVAGTVDGIIFEVNDRAIAITDDASTITFAGNWIKSDYTDAVLSVAGKTGAVELVSDDITNFDASVSSNDAVVLNTAKVSFPEAPIDGLTRARKDGAWEEITTVVATSDIVLIPDYVLPNSSVKVVILAKNINNETVASFGGSVNLTSQSVKLNKFGGLIVECFISVGTTEEFVNVTLNNGLETVYNSVFSVINGTLYRPTLSDWKDVVGTVDLTQESKIISGIYNVTGAASWNKVFDSRSDYIVKFKVAMSPLGQFNQNNGTQFRTIKLNKVTDDTPLFSIYIRDDGRPRLQYASVLRSRDYFSPNIALGDTNGFTDILLADANVEFRNIGGEMYLYNNNSLVFKFEDVVEDLYFQGITDSWDLNEIEYIDLSTIEEPPSYSDNYIATGDKTSRLVNDGKDGEGSYAETAIATADTGQIISLNNAVGNYCNMDVLSLQDTFTIGDRVVGGFAMVLIDISGMTNYPVVTGSIFIETIGDFSLLTATVLEMVVWYDGTNVNNYFLTR